VTPTPPAGQPVTGGQWQVRFDNGHQQRYLADRSSALRCILGVAAHAASPLFEVFAETEPVRLADGSPAGRRFVLAEVIDLSRPGEADRVREELEALPGVQPTVPPQAAPEPPASPDSRP
jgi:hypothetical protein